MLSMLRSKLFALLVLVPLAALPATLAVRAQQGPDLARLVREQAAKLTDQPGEELWRQVRALADLARQIEGQELAPAVDPLIADAKSLSASGKLFAVALRLQASDPDAGKLAALLVPLFASDQPAVPLAAAQLASDPHFKLL